MEKFLSKAKEYIQPGEQRRRLLMTVFGVLVCGLGVSLSRMADFGVDPFQCLCSGIYKISPIAQGTTYVLINAVLLIAVFIYDKHYIGLGTLINMFLLGYVADGGEQLMLSIWPRATITLAGQIAFLVAAILVLCLSGAFYITADLGVSTYDAIALHLTAKKLGPYRLLRIGTDLICVGIGFALGYVPGVCTIITALMMGPLTSFFMDHIAKRVRYGKQAS